MKCSFRPAACVHARLVVVTLFLATLVGPAFPAGVHADPPESERARPSVSWKDYPPNQRRELRQRYLQSLPEEERARLRDQAERFRHRVVPHQRVQDPGHDQSADSLSPSNAGRAALDLVAAGRKGLVPGCRLRLRAVVSRPACGKSARRRASAQTRWIWAA